MILNTQDMTRLEQLTTIHERLDELNKKYLIARTTKDKRRREKAIREAKKIEYFSAFIPYDIKKIFDDKVGANSLNFQHADDISQCIDILEQLIYEEKV